MKQFLGHSTLSNDMVDLWSQNVSAPSDCWISRAHALNSEAGGALGMSLKQSALELAGARGALGR